MDIQLLRHLLQQPEGLKLDFKQKLHEIDHTDKQVANRHWNELIKDILALTNGNIGVVDNIGYLIIGVADKLKSDGSRDLFDVGTPSLTSQRLLQRLNDVCHPPIPNILVEIVNLDGSNLLIIAIPPSPYLHETKRALETPSKAVHPLHTVFIRRNEDIGPASTEERLSLFAEKQRHFQSVLKGNSTAQLTHPNLMLPLDSVPGPAALPEGSRMPYGHNPLFVGRETELRELARAMQPYPPTIATITGIGGVGKTQLASEFAHRYGQFFPGGVYSLNFSDAHSIIGEITSCGGSSGMNLPYFADLSLDDQVERVLREWRQPIPRLLIFDNCEDEAILAHWRPSTGGCRILITSRRTTWDPALGVTPFDIHTLPRVESIALIRALASMVSDTEADDIAQELGDLPLALHLAGKFLRCYHNVVTPSTYLQQLRNPQLLQHRSFRNHGYSPTGHMQDITRTFALSYDRLIEDDAVDALARSLLTRIAYLAPGVNIPRELIERLLHREDDDPDALFLMEDAIARLVDLGLIERSGEDALRMHRLLSVFAQSMNSDNDTQKMVDETVFALSCDIDEGETLAPLLALLPHLTVVTDRAAPRNDEGSAALCNQLGYTLDVIGDYQGSHSYLQRALVIREAIYASQDRDLEQNVDLAQSLFNLGSVEEKLGDYQRARTLLERALSVYESVHDADPIHITTILHSLGDLLREIGEYDQAGEYLQRALKLRVERLGEHHPEVASTLISIGVLLNELGLSGDAQDLFEQALAIQKRRLGSSHPSTASSYSTLSALFADRGAYVTAQKYAEQALAIDEAFFGSMHPHVATDLNNLASILRGHNDYARAYILYERALNISQTVYGDEHPAIALIYHNLGFCHRKQGNFNDARTYYDQALQIHLHTFGEQHRLTALSLQAIAELLIDQGDEVTGRQYQERARAIEMAIFGENHRRFGEPEIGTLAYRRPSLFLEIPEEEIDLRTKCNEDLCVIDDEKFFIRGVLKLPIRETDNHFAWGVWIQVAQVDFERYLDLWDTENVTDETSMTGHLANEIETYVGSEGLEVHVHLQAEKQRPLFVVDSEQHPLGVDQRIGITSERVTQFWQALGQS